MIATITRDVVAAIAKHREPEASAPVAAIERVETIHHRVEGLGGGGDGVAFGVDQIHDSVATPPAPSCGLAERVDGPLVDALRALTVRCEDRAELGGDAVQIAVAVLGLVVGNGHHRLAVVGLDHGCPNRTPGRQEPIGEGPEGAALVAEDSAFHPEAFPYLVEIVRRWCGR